MAEGNLRNWNKGNRLSAAHLQEPIDILRKFLAIPGSGIGQEGGSYVRPVFDLYLGKIVAAGPASEVDYTDERYWVKPQYIVGTTLTKDLITTGDIVPPTSDDYSVDAVLTVTNIPEVLNHSHDLPVGSLVLYLVIYDWQQDSKAHHIMSEGGSLPPAQYQGMVLVNVVDGRWGADYVPAVEALS